MTHPRGIAVSRDFLGQTVLSGWMSERDARELASAQGGVARYLGRGGYWEILLNNKPSNKMNEFVQHAAYQEIEGRECTITLEPRPSYCDRGNFIAKLHTHGDFAGEVDAQDLWPRYYFDEDRAKAEIIAWLQKRKQLV